MKRPGFFEGALLALALSLVGSLAYGALNLIFPAALVLPLVIAGLSLAYLLYLLHRSPERVGRLTTLAVWFVMAALVWLWPLGLPLYVLAHLGTLWLVRSLYFHGSLTAAVADLMLSGLALIAALWAIGQTGSLFASLWCFFLVQALFSSIRGPAHGAQGTAGPDPEDRFGQAHRAAEAALRRLSSS
jgi:NAD/NADP transhydrogenase beta subunit